ncbi:MULTISPECIES: TetR/AcrR family transcriptional regulator [unclassified Gordonia (in: high G+C Gram-positive bacteria)]
MGRAVTHDRGRLVSDARDLFWRKGFDAVSVADVEAATGVGRSSIYHAFGNMRGLFDAAVTDYLDTIVRPRLRPMTVEKVDGDAVIDYLRGLGDAIAVIDRDGAAPAGCLLLTTAAGNIGGDDAVAQVVAAYHRELSTAIARGVQAHLPDADATTWDRLTRMTVAASIAALSLARVDADAACATIDAAIATLSAAPTEVRRR